MLSVDGNPFAERVLYHSGHRSLRDFHRNHKSCWRRGSPRGFTPAWYCLDASRSACLSVSLCFCHEFDSMDIYSIHCKRYSHWLPWHLLKLLISHQSFDSCFLAFNITFLLFTPADSRDLQSILRKNKICLSSFSPPRSGYCGRRHEQFRCGALGHQWIRDRLRCLFCQQMPGGRPRLLLCHLQDEASAFL